MIKIQEVEQIFKDLFEEEEGKVTSVETLYEKPESEKFLKLIISIHGLSIEDEFIIHTKFIFKTDLEKMDLIDNSFIYLYDINCVYRKIDFDNPFDLKEKIEKIFNNSDFGEDIKILSDFIGAPAMFINHYLRRSRITDYSVFDVKYDPKFKTQPCQDTTFDFDININNNWDISLSIHKNDRNEDEGEKDTYSFRFKFLDEVTNTETDSLLNIHYYIGSQLAKILDKKLK